MTNPLPMASAGGLTLGASTKRPRTYVQFEVARRQSTRVRVLRRVLPIRIPTRRSLAICLVYAAIGFTPIGALALSIGGLWSLPIGSVVLIVPAIFAAIGLGIAFPRHGHHAAEGLVAGLAAVLVYDSVRWAFIALGWWGDFIPNIGGWLNGTGQPNWLLGYGFRWLGDGGGMGLAFMVAVRSFVPQPARWAAVALGVAYGLSIWLCLLVTLIVSPAGQDMLFQLNTGTLLMSWIGHVVYGAVLGAFVRPYSARKNATRSLCSWVVKPAAKMAS